ncbi:MAG: 4Fe-4S dicluster domain-containing protein [Bacteroidales bacterium]|nr:4Fe-4S dicluster domain-containing protein [Bacteroidales bacterium]
MKFRHLRTIRIIISLLLLIISTFLFLDFNDFFSTEFISGFFYLQFIPSVLNFITTFSIAASGFIIVIITIVLFGRVYCSTICPLGILQDVIIYLSNKIRKRKFVFLKARNFLRYSIMIASVGLAVFGSMVLINLLDPYSNFGRIVSNLIRPVYYGVNNLLAGIFESFNNYYFFTVEVKDSDLLTIIFTAIFLVTLIFLASTRGRIFCNTICPLGSLMGLISKISIFKIKIDEKACISCRKCEFVCKAGCIDTKNKTIDFSRCINCFDCFSACNLNGISYKLSLKESKKNNSELSDKSRRKIISGATLGLLGLPFILKAKSGILPEKLTKVVEQKTTQVCPPGSNGLNHFTEFCIACQLCVSNCPTKVLQPSFLEYGLKGIMQPKMDFYTSFCNFECVKCSEICPTGAILPIELENKKLTQIGIAHFIKENCIVYTENTDCGACSEHCPTKAVDMIPYGNNLRIPEVDSEICIGCGACEYACPTKPYKAIFVDGNALHLKIEKTKQKSSGKKVDYKEEFPF